MKIRFAFLMAAALLLAVASGGPASADSASGAESTAAISSAPFGTPGLGESAVRVSDAASEGWIIEGEGEKTERSGDLGVLEGFERSPWAYVLVLVVLVSMWLLYRSQRGKRKGR